jgi:WD40 repeat protein
MAVGDDSGVISLVPIESKTHQPVSVTASGTRVKRLNRVHSNLIGALSFRPNSKYVSSGGFDCLLCEWDVGFGRPTGTINFASSDMAARIVHSAMPLTEPSAVSAPFVNPPFVHAISHIFEGRAVVAALGNGMVSSATLTRSRQCQVHLY